VEMDIQRNCVRSSCRISLEFQMIHDPRSMIHEDAKWIMERGSWII
jgi:hypothetical protein